MVATKADDPHCVPTHGENDEIGLSVQPVSQRQISFVAVIFSRVSPDDDGCPIEHRHVVEPQAALADVPGIVRRIVAELHPLLQPRKQKIPEFLWQQNMANRADLA
jgi:hypothetical protein